jgi:hypothetical protein
MNNYTATDIAVIASTVISFLALIAAAFSAAAAYQSGKTADTALRHVRITELMSFAERVVSDEMLIKFLSSELKMTMQFVATASGAVGGSRYLFSNTQLDEECSTASSLAKGGQAALDESESLLSATDAEITQKTIELRKCAAQIQVIKEKIEHQLSQYRQLQHSYREKLIQSRAH